MKTFDPVEFFEAENKLYAIARLCDAIGLRPGMDTEVSLHYYSGELFPLFYVTLSVNARTASLDAIRRVKRLVVLEVPSYAADGAYKEPPLHGELQVGPDDLGNRLTLAFSLHGSYVCEQVGTQEKEPSENDLKRANELAEMDEAAVMAAHRAKIAELRATREVPRYRCEPSVRS